MALVREAGRTWTTSTRGHGCWPSRCCYRNPNYSATTRSRPICISCATSCWGRLAASIAGSNGRVLTSPDARVRCLGKAGLARLAARVHDVPNQADENLLDRVPLAGVAHHDGDVRLEGQGDPDVVGLESGSVVEAVDGDDERGAVPLEVVDRGEAIGHSPRIRHDHGTDRPDRQVIPHEPEALLAGRAEQVQHELGREADAAEIHGHRCGGLSAHAVGVVDATAALAER